MNQPSRGNIVSVYLTQISPQKAHFGFLLLFLPCYILCGLCFSHAVNSVNSGPHCGTVLSCFHMLAEFSVLPSYFVQQLVILMRLLPVCFFENKQIIHQEVKRHWSTPINSRSLIV